jgi:hypothetical protein
MKHLTPSELLQIQKLAANAQIDKLQIDPAIANSLVDHITILTAALLPFARMGTAIRENPKVPGKGVFTGMHTPTGPVEVLIEDFANAEALLADEPPAPPSSILRMVK